MGILRQLFGPSQAEVWRRLAEETGSSFVDGGFWRGSKNNMRWQGKPFSPEDLARFMARSMR